MYKLFISIVTALSIGFLAMLPLAAKSVKAEDKIDLSPLTLAEFKGNCLRMKGMLKYENDQWACHAKTKSEEGLTPLPVFYPKT